MQGNEITWIAADRLRPHPDNPRRDVGDVTELADSIRAKGIMQNLTVVPDDPADPDTTYTVIIGHRRLAAARQAGLAELPCAIVNMTYQEQLETMLLENMQRADLTVCEQALGMEQLSMLGEDVAEIAAKTGFSQTTVRRRLRIAELDHDTLRAVSGRQVTLADYERLQEIGDPAKRTEILAKIGTPDYNAAVNGAIREEKIARCQAEAAPLLRKYHIHKMAPGEQWGTNWRQREQIEYDDWRPALLDKYASGGKYGYLYEYNRMLIYERIETPKAPPRPASEIAREKYIAETRDRLNAIAAEAYELRRTFMADIRVSERNVRAMIRGAYYSIFSQAIQYNGGTVRDLCRSREDNEAQRWLDDNALWDAAKHMFDEDSNQAVPAAIYAGFGDSEKVKCWSDYSREFPAYKRNKALDMLYEWLVLELGYELSDVELQMISGTHPLYVDKDAGKNAGGR